MYTKLQSRPSDGERPLGIPRRRWEYNNQIDLKHNEGRIMD